MPAPHPGMNLPKLTSQAELERTVANDPIGAIERLIRTPEELSEAIDHLVSDHMYYESNKIEFLILEMIRLNYPNKEVNKVASWYCLCNKSETGHSRPDSELIRAFRFLRGTSPIGYDASGMWNTYQICFWHDSVINDMVRKHPWLYWCHKWYQDYIAGTLDEFAKRDHSKPYSDREWQAVERAIRRVVDAGDWSLFNQVYDIYRLHQEGKMEIDKNSGEGKDPFTPNRINVFLEDAVGLLARQRTADSMPNAQTFGTALETRGDFKGKIFVEVSFPKNIYIKNGENGISPLSVVIFVLDLCDRAKLIDLLSRVSLELEIDGGYFPSIGNNGCSERRMFKKESSGGGCGLYFIPFEGRGRLTLTLSYDGRDEIGKKDSSFSTVARYFFEAKGVQY